jgi:hypothetical protein
MKTLYFKGFDAIGSQAPTGNYFESTLVTPTSSVSGAQDRTTVRTILERDKHVNEFVTLDNAFIVYNTKIIPHPTEPNLLSGINKKYRIQVFTINIDNDYIECEHQGFYDSVVTSVPTLEYAVRSASGRFKKVKRVVVDFDNYNGKLYGNTNEPADWNLEPRVIYNRRIKFYSC